MARVYVGFLVFGYGRRSGSFLASVFGCEGASKRVCLKLDATVVASSLPSFKAHPPKQKKHQPQTRHTHISQVVRFNLKMVSKPQVSLGRLRSF